MSVFHTLVNLGKRLLAGNPRLESGLKHAYQHAVYFASPRIRREGALTRLTPRDGGNWFIGNYGKSPWDMSGKRIICLRAGDIDSSAPDDIADICMLEDGRATRLADTRTWNTQQGCMLGWLGPDCSDRIIYNDFRDGKYVSVIFSVSRRAEISVLDMPVYAVSDDGKTALSLDFVRLNRLCPGYGYSNLPDATWGDPCPDSPCIWRIDIENNGITPILTYSALRDFESKPSMNGAEHEISRLSINPSGTRFMALHRWREGKRRHSRLITFDMDGSRPFTLADEDFVSHSFWTDDMTVVSYCRLGGSEGYFRLSDMSVEYLRIWRELDTDGHMSISPRGLAVTDTYPDKRRLQSVYVMDGENVTRLARVFSPFKFDGDIRCDLHPRFDRTGERIAIDATFEGERALYSLPSAPVAAPPKVLTVITVPTAFNGPTMTVIRYARAMDKGAADISFLSINDPPEEIVRQISDMGGRLFTIKGRLKNPIAYMFKLALLIRREKFDVVHVHGNSCTLAIDLLNAYLGGAHTRIAHSHNTQCKYLRLHKLLRPLFDRLYTHAYACGPEAGRWLFGGKPFKVARIAIETSDFAYDPAARAEYRAMLGAGHDTLIGSVANFSPQKNHAFLLDAFAKFLKIDPSAKLALVGDGVLRGEVERRIADLGIGASVYRLGVRSDVPKLIQAFDVMLLPSLYEGFPNVLIEWQCAGLMSLVSDTVTRSAALTPLVEYLPISGGADIWADALMQCDHTADRARLSREAIAAVRAQGYDISENAMEMCRVYISAPRRRASMRGLS